MSTKTCTEPTEPVGHFHTHDTTVWFRLAYGPLRLWRVIPHRWVTRPCPAALIAALDAAEQRGYDKGIAAADADWRKAEMLRRRDFFGGAR